MVIVSKSPRALRVKTRGQFNLFLDHLVTETHRAWDHWSLWGRLDAAIADYTVEMNQTPQFWNLTLRAHQDIVILRLGRLFDPTEGALSLCQVLQTICDSLTHRKLSHLCVSGIDPTVMG